MDALYVFVTTAFPKAGAQVAGLPLTLNLLLTIYVILRHPNQTLLSIQKHHSITLAYSILFVFGVLSMLLAFVQGAAPFTLSQMLIVVGSPLVGIAAFRIPPERFAKIIIISMLIVNTYAIVQYVFGVESTAIEGLTYTYGQSLSDKPIGFKADGTTEKMISTYQNGNSYGLFDALGLGYLMIRLPLNRRWNFAKITALLVGFIGFMLSGSRSIQIPFCICLVFVLVQSVKQTPPRLRQNIIAGITLGCCALIAFAFSQPSMILSIRDRLITQTLADPTASGRTEQWRRIFDAVAQMDGGELFRQLLLGGNPTKNVGEGLPYFFAVFGLPCTLAFFIGLVSLVAICWRGKNTRTIALGILCVAIAFCVDSSYMYPPCIMNVYLFYAAAQKLEKTSVSKNSAQFSHLKN